MSKHRFFWLWLLGTAIGTALVPLLLYTLFRVELSKNLPLWMGSVTGIWIAGAIVYFWRVRGSKKDSP